MLSNLNFISVVKILHSVINMKKDSEKQPTSVGVTELTTEVPCGKCRKIVELEDTEVTERDNGRPMIEGNCPDCGSKIIVHVHTVTENE